MAVYIPGKWIHKAYGSVMLAVLLLAFLPGMTAKKEMKGFCEGLAAGASVAEVKSSAAAHEYEFSPLVDGRALIEDEGNFGPQKCDVRFGTSGLLSAQYIFNG
jgi:hypothetical protein